MADLFYRVYIAASEVALGQPVSEGTVAITGASTASAAVMDASGGNRQRRVRLWADVDCFVTWGESPTAANDGTSGIPVGAKNPEYVGIAANEKIAVIQKV